MKYSHIPAITADYMLTVSCRKSLKELSLSEINEYLGGLEEYYTTKSSDMEFNLSNGCSW